MVCCLLFQSVDICDPKIALTVIVIILNSLKNIMFLFYIYDVFFLQKSFPSLSETLAYLKWYESNKLNYKTNTGIWYLHSIKVCLTQIGMLPLKDGNMIVYSDCVSHKSW